MMFFVCDLEHGRTIGSFQTIEEAYQEARKYKNTRIYKAEYKNNNGDVA